MMLIQSVQHTVGTNATGNVITSSDTDTEGDTLTVSAITGGSVGSAVTGTYGTFTLNSNGSYTYVVDSTNSNVFHGKQAMQRYRNFYLYSI